MNIHPTRWISLLTLALAIGVGLPTLAQRGDSPDDGFGPPEGHGGPPLLDEHSESEDGDSRRRLGLRLDDQDLDAAQSIIAQVYPELAERLAQLRADDPRQFKQTLERRFPRVRFLVELQKRDPAMFELRMADIRLDRQTDLLAQQLRDAREADDKVRYKELRDQIEAKVAEHFDIRQAIRAMEIEHLKLKLEELEERLDERDDDRKDLIEQRVEELAGRDW